MGRKESNQTNKIPFGPNISYKILSIPISIKNVPPLPLLDWSGKIQGQNFKDLAVNFFFLVRLDSLRPNQQQLWSCQDGQFS